MVPEALKHVLETLNVRFAAVADLESGDVRFIGEPQSVGDTDLISTLFGDWETVEALNRSLEGQLLPRSWNQGQASCIVCKPVNGIIVGVFVLDELDAVEQYRWSKEADEAIRTAFSTSAP